MKKYGMLMTPENAQRTHDGDKTVTRRVMKPQPTFGRDLFPTEIEDMVEGSMESKKYCFTIKESRGVTRYLGSKNFTDEFAPWQPGMIVSIKETHWRWGQLLPSTSEAGRPSRRFEPSCYKQYGDEVLFCDPQRTGSDVSGNSYHKRPSRFLPFDLARTHVKILDVRAEMLQDCTGADAIREGWPREQELYPGINTEDKALAWLIKKWDSINAARGYPWAGNWWVWRYEYERCEI